MLSTIVVMPPFAKGEAPSLGALVRTLAALVPPTVEGLVRDVTVLADEADEGVQRVADHAGCRLIERRGFGPALAEALVLVRSPMLFILRAGAAFDRGFVDEVAGLLGPQREAAAPAVLLLRQAPDTMLTRMLPDLAPVVGLIAPRAALPTSAGDLAGLARRVGRTHTLVSRAQMA